MDHWLEILNGFLQANLDREQALTAYAELHISLVRIHPFVDGNGRIARLVANLPVLHSGWPPILIPKHVVNIYDCYQDMNWRWGPLKLENPYCQTQNFSLTSSDFVRPPGNRR
jgi:hypothetical protein